MKTIFKGSDIKLQLLITDDNFNAIDINNASRLNVYLIQNESVVSKYSTNDKLDGYGKIKIEKDHVGLVTIPISSTETSSMDEGDVYAELHLTQSDEDFTDKNNKSIKSEILVFKVKKSIANEGGK